MTHATMPAVLAFAALAAAASSVAAQPPTPPRGLRVDVPCSAVVDRDQLIAALALELIGTDWVIGGRELAVTVEASPCDADTPVQLMMDAWPAGQLRLVGPVSLPAPARARGLALLIADMVTDLPVALPPPPPAIDQLPPPPRAIDQVPPPPAIAQPAPPAAIAQLPLAPPRIDALAQPTTAFAPAATEVALTGIRRWYIERRSLDSSVAPGQVSTGARVTVTRSALVHWLRGGLDLGADLVDERDYRLFTGRAGAQLGVRIQPTAALAIDLAGRFELALAYVQRGAERKITDSTYHPLMAAYFVGAGGLLATSLVITPSITARFEVEFTRQLSTTTFDILDISAGQTSFGVVLGSRAAFGSSIAFSFGLAMR